LEFLRADKFLWHIRLFKSRSLAQYAIESGHVRINGSRMERTSCLVHLGDVLTLPRGDDVIALRVIAIPDSRASAPAAMACFQCL
jgi:ribosomal 50S subunit-recycling heat shock protein